MEGGASGREWGLRAPARETAEGGAIGRRRGHGSWGRGHGAGRSPCKRAGGRSPGRGVAKGARGRGRGLTVGLQVAPVSGFSTRGRGQRRRAQVCAPVCVIPVPPSDYTWAASRPYKGPGMQSSLQIATGWQTWGRGAGMLGGSSSKFTGSACSGHLTEGRELPPECPGTMRTTPKAPTPPKHFNNPQR